MQTVSTEHKRTDIRRNDTVKVITGRDKGAVLRELVALVAKSWDIPESFPNLLYGANCRSIMA